MPASSNTLAMKETADRANHPPRPRRILTSENLIFGSVFVFFLTVYVATLCPAVFWWDSGELIANVAVLGIPHRPGFPIYMLLARLFSYLPLGSFALRVNLLSAVCAAGSLAILYKVFRSGIRHFFPEAASRSRWILFSGLCFLLVLGFTYSLWIQAVRAEVYSLNLLFFSLLLYLCALYLEGDRPGHICLFFFLLGLGLGNHHLSLLSTVPALGFLLATSVHPSGIRWKRIPLYGFLLLLGLSVYLYIPIRSLADPPLAWGDIRSVSSSAGSVLALDSIRNMDLGFVSNLAANAEKMVRLFSDQLTFPGLVLSLFGLLALFRKNRRLLVFLLILIAGNCAAVLFMANEFIPTNPDLHGYLVYSIFALALAYGTAVFFLLTGVRRPSSVWLRVSAMVLGSISLLPLMEHFPEADLSQNHIAHRYGVSVISDLDSNSVLFADNVNLSFILRELQYAEGMRKDVAVIDRGLLGFGWYARQKRRQLEPLFAGTCPTATGEPLFRALLRNCVYLDRPTYVEFTERDSALVDYLTPGGYVFKVSPAPSAQLSEADLLHQERWDKLDPFGSGREGVLGAPDNRVFARDWDAQRVFALSFFRLGLFYEWKGMASRALDKFARVAGVDPLNQELLLRMRRLQETEALSEPSVPQSLVDG